MNVRHTLARTAMVTCALAAFPLSAMSADFRAVDHPVQGSYIVVLKSEAASLAGEKSSAARVADVGRQMTTQYRVTLTHSYDHVLRGFAVRADDAALARLLADPRVDYVQEDGRVSAVGGSGQVSIKANQSPVTWPLDRIDQTLLPLNNNYIYNKAGAGVHAYIVDSGILATHNEFATRISNGYTAIAAGGTNDCYGHGTHAAGSIGGATYGVAKSVALHPVRVLDCTGAGTIANVLSGMNWVTANRLAPAVAYLGFSSPANATVDTAVAQMTNAGIVVVASAGSNNADACNYSPGRAPSAITVSASTSADAAAAFANYGSCVDLYAPGQSITSSWIGSNVAISTISGVAKAAAFVVGAAALYQQGNPTASPATVTSAILTTTTAGVLTGVPPLTPNRLLYTLSL